MGAAVRQELEQSTFDDRSRESLPRFAFGNALPYLVNFSPISFLKP